MTKPILTYSSILTDTKRQTWEREWETLQIIQDLVDLHFSLFKHPGKLDISKETKLQRVWLTLVTRASHSSRLGLYALESGYYAQSFALTRAVLEDWLVAFDCKDHPETVDALLDCKGSVPRFSAMAKRLPCNLRRLWGEYGDDEGNYGYLSTFAHPRARAMQDTLNREGRVRVVPEYDEIRFALAAHSFVTAIMLQLEFEERLADHMDSPESREWKNSDLATVKPKCYALLEALNGRLLSYLQ